MGKISSYINASSPISGADKLIGTDSANNNETKNFTVQEIADFVGLGPYKVYTALLTQSGSGSNIYITTGPLTIGVTYWIDDNTGGVDFTNVGAPNNNLDTAFVATGTTPNSWGTGGQLGYNTGAPVATVLENTIGNIWFSYQADGVYRIVSNGLFLENKTYVSITDNRFPGDPTVDLRIIKADLGNDDVIDINTLQYSIDGGWNGGGNQNYILLNTPIEIRVYN